MQAEAHHGISSRLTVGRIEGITVPDLLWSLSAAQATGVLHLTAGSTTKRVFFSEGRIVFAASNEPNDRLGETLLRRGTIRLDHFEHAVARLSEGRRLGAILVEAGHLSPEDLVRAVLDQVRLILWSLFSWDEGTYQFEEGPLRAEEVVELNIDTAAVILTGLRSLRSFQRLRVSVGPPSARYQAVEGWREKTDALDLTDGERQLLERLEGDGATLDRVCREVFLSNFEIYQAIWAFKLLGFVRECHPEAFSVGDSLADGRLDRDGVGKLLVRLSRSVETGVLQVTRGTAERSFHLREGRLVFATSNNVDDGLVAYLLRRGMISLRDREETTRRLLSNKRVGQILLDMSVIDEDELAHLVREHQLEIVYDTFRWEDGGWTWMSGELPTIESIVLDRTIEDLVFSGLRRVASWPRVREGCGGLSTRLELTPKYLEILDRMSVASDDWDLVTMLRTPRTPLELCRASNLGDFRVCQTLWALRVLGAVDEAPLEAAVEAAFGTMVTEAAPSESEASAPAAPEPEPDPEPISPAAVASAEPFEVTSVQEMMPDAPQRDEALPASHWSEPEHETRPPWAWRGSDDTPPVDLSNVADAGEVISEPWRLSGEEPPRAVPADAEDVRAVPQEAPGEESAFAIVPEEDGPAQGPDDRTFAEPAVAALFEVPSPEIESRRDIGMDLPVTHRASADHPEDDLAGADLADDEAPTCADTDTGADAPREEHVDIAPAEDEFASMMRDDRETDAPAEAFPEANASWPAESGEADAEPAEASSPSAAPPEVPSEPPWDAPPELDLEIAHFVERHKIVFRVIRSEVGAGALNFVRSCRAALGNGIGDLLGDAEMQPDGSWNADELRKLVCERRIFDASSGLRRLIGHEVEALRAQIGERRTKALLEQIGGI